MNDNGEAARQRAAAAVAEIRAEVERLADSRAAPETVALERALAELRYRSTVSAHWGIVPTWPAFGRVEVLAKRVIRILLRWYINPIVEQQNRFNLAAIAAIYDLEAQIHANTRNIRQPEARSESNSPE